MMLRLISVKTTDKTQDNRSIWNGWKYFPSFPFPIGSSWNGMHYCKVQKSKQHNMTFKDLSKTWHWDRTRILWIFLLYIRVTVTWLTNGQAQLQTLHAVMIKTWPIQVCSKDISRLVFHGSIVMTVSHISVLYTVLQAASDNITTKTCVWGNKST